MFISWEIITAEDPQLVSWTHYFAKAVVIFSLTSILI